MDKDKINSKIEDLEAELAQLKKLAQEPAKRLPERGEVWIDRRSDSYYIINNLSRKLQANNVNGSVYTYPGPDPFEGDGDNFTYLGKFDEVYVKISDVKEALELGDEFGDQPFWEYTGVFRKSHEALAKLNITED